MAKKSGDQFANIAAVRALETVAGTAAYTRYNFPYSIQDKVAILISRIEYWFGNLHQLNTDQDYVVAGLVAASSVTSLEDQSNSLIVDSMRILRVDHGTAGSAVLETLPIVKDWSTLPGGGILVAPSPLYAAIQSSGAGGVLACWVKLFYTYRELATDEYWELVESRRLISSD